MVNNIYDISLNSEKKKMKIKPPNFSGSLKHNTPFLAALIVNIVVFLFTAFNPQLMMWLAIGTESSLGIFTAYTFNFTHAGLFHIVMNILVLFVFQEQIRLRLYYKKWAQWFLYFGTPLVIGLILFVIGTPPTVGYSGVVMALLTFGIVFKFDGYKSIAIQLVLFHIIAFLVTDVWLGINISFIGHAVGAVVGASFAWYMRNYKKYHTWKYKKTKSKETNWRDRHNKM